MFRMNQHNQFTSSRTTPLRRAQRAVVLFSLALLTGCQGTTVSPEASAPSRVRFMDYRQGTVFELVNEAHTDRVELYSELRANTETKVTSDEVMDALLEYLQDAGFHGKTRAGSAPRSSDTYLWGGEIERDGVTKYMIVGDQTSAADRQLFIDCYMNHVTLWSNTFQLQRVDAGPGDVFKKPELRQ